jgi:signal transduction histidine kinase
MLDRLEKVFQSQQRFVADASHELKTPLTILMGELDVLRQQTRSIPDYQTFLASASEELQRLAQIIQNLLLLAQADSGKPLVLRENVRLDEVVLGVVERLQPFAKGAQVQVRVNVNMDDSDLKNQKSKIKNQKVEEPFSVRGDADLLGSLFFNLIHNAIKYSAAGQLVEVRLGRAADGSRVVVRDFGSGIRAGELPRLFERFHRAENPTRSRHGGILGTGLGLTIARWIAEAHGAQISVESKPAEGSIFTVNFSSNPARGDPVKGFVGAAEVVGVLVAQWAGDFFDG